MKHKNTTHGHWVDNKPSKTYASWRSMKYRCSNPKNKYYHQQGIKVCNRWLNSFENFLEDMGERPEGKTIDRINRFGNYEPSNCKWSTVAEQNNNKKISNKCPITGKFIP